MSEAGDRSDHPERSEGSLNEPRSGDLIAHGVSRG